MRGHRFISLFWRGCREQDFGLMKSNLNIVRELASSETKPESAAYLQRELFKMERLWKLIGDKNE